MKEEKVKENYETPETEEVTTVSKDLMNSMQDALSKATETINKLKEDVASSNDKYIRALADYQNLKRISDDKIFKSKDAGKISVFKDLLPIVDDFEKAKESGELSEGVELIYNKIMNMFKVNGIEVIDPKEGEVFDDSVHEAVVAVPNSGNEINTIIFTQFKGYKLGNTVLRYAKVAVAV